MLHQSGMSGMLLGAENMMCMLIRAAALPLAVICSWCTLGLQFDKPDVDVHLPLYCHCLANTDIEYYVTTVMYEVTLACTLAHMHSTKVVVSLVDGVVLLAEQRGLLVV